MIIVYEIWVCRESKKIHKLNFRDKVIGFNNQTEFNKFDKDFRAMFKLKKLEVDYCMTEDHEHWEE